MKKVTWRTWTWIAVFVAIYLACGFAYAKNGIVESWLYRIGLTAATIAPLLFIGIYTILGFRGSAKWWLNSLGTALVQAALTLVPIAAPLAWVFWVDGGVLTSSWLAWIEVSGPAVSALAWLRLGILWILIYRNDKAKMLNNGSSDHS